MREGVWSRGNNEVGKDEVATPVAGGLLLIKRCCASLYWNVWTGEQRSQTSGLACGPTFSHVPVQVFVLPSLCAGRIRVAFLGWYDCYIQ